MRKKSRTKKTTGTFLVPCLFSVCKSLIIMLYNEYVLNYLILLSSVSSLPTEKLFILFCVKVVIDAYSVFQDYLFPTWTFWTVDTPFFQCALPYLLFSSPMSIQNSKPLFLLLGLLLNLGLQNPRQHLNGHPSTCLLWLI